MILKQNLDILNYYFYSVLQKREIIICKYYLISLQIKLSNTRIDEIEIFDLLGRTRKRNTSSSTSLFIDDLLSGFYLLKVRFEVKQRVMKFEKR